MVKGYELKCDYGCIGGMYEHESYENIGADYVLASDYAALEAENATLAADRDSETRWACQYKAERDAANATLDALRVVVNQNEWDRAQNGDVLSQFRTILQPEEKP